MGGASVFVVMDREMDSFDEIWDSVVFHAAGRARVWGAGKIRALITDRAEHGDLVIVRDRGFVALNLVPSNRNP